MKRSKIKIFIHPGFGKSGTTTLQNSVFPKFPDINLVGRPYSLKPGNRQLSYNLKKNSPFFDFDLTRNLSLKLINKKKINILSEETLCTASLKNEAVIQRLSKFYPDAKIFFTIRNQYDAAISYYINHERTLRKSPKPFLGSFVSFNNWFDYAFEEYENNFLGELDYYSMISLYEKYFKQKNIKIFLFEDFINNNQIYIRNILSFCGVKFKEIKITKENPRITDREFTYYKLRSKLPQSSITNLIPFGQKIIGILNRFLQNKKPAKILLNKSQKDSLMDIYSENNIKLNKAYNLKLGNYRYPGF
tara:strand:- start:296 stop:1207 length:912 start_codon:yes stop_codon:yes gene_type:complete